jgi:hypothetical protein
MRFDGAEYQPTRDDARLTGQLLRIWNVVCDQQWRTLEEISRATGDPQASISAQLRHLRKPRFGGHEVEKLYVANGLYRYRVIPNKTEYVR